MKIRELLCENQMPSRAEVDAWMRKYMQSVSKKPRFEIFDEWVNFYGDFRLDYDCSVEELPFRIGRVDGNFFMSMVKKLKSTKNFPFEVQENVIIFNTNIDTLEGMPLKIGGHLNIGDTQIKTLDTFTHIFEKMEVPEIRCNWQKIKRGGIGLLLIKNLQKIDNSLGSNFLSHDSPFQIISKYIGRPNDIYECQAELIDNGFEEYAKL